MIGHGTWVRCDDCPVTAVTNVQFVQARGYLRKQGWTFTDIGFHWCPECSDARGRTIDPRTGKPRGEARATPTNQQLPGIHIGRKAAHQ